MPSIELLAENYYEDMVTTEQKNEIINAWGEAAFLEAAPRDVVMKVLKICTLQEIADKCGCCSSALLHRVRKAKVKPSAKIGERLYFTEDEAKRAVDCWVGRVRLLPDSRWTQDMVNDIRQRWLKGETQASIAASYNVNQGTISNVIKGVRMSVKSAKEVAAAAQSPAPSTAPSPSAPSQSAA